MSTSSAGSVAVYIRGSVPIPVGHRVEVVLLKDADAAASALVDQPVVTDLETGVTYGDLEHFVTLHVYRETELFHPPTTTLPHLREHTRWSGKVLLCQVLHFKSPGRIQTTLVVAPDPVSELPYR